MRISLDSKRLKLRSFEQSDWKDMQELWVDYANSSYSCYDQSNPLDDVSVYDRIKVWICVNNTMTCHHYFAVCLQSKVIGFFSVHPYRDGCELGYAFHSNYHGFGYASEALTTLLHYLKANKCIFCYVRTGIKNEPSVAFLSRNGFNCIDTEKISFYSDENNKPIFFTGGIFVNKLK